jgi:hypothetical protein
VHVSEQICVRQRSAALAGVRMCEPISSALQAMSTPCDALSRLRSRRCAGSKTNGKNAGGECSLG